MGYNLSLVKKNIRLIVLTSTLPRWDNDSTTAFVWDHSRLLSKYVNKVTIIAPHFKGAKTKELVAPNIEINRVKYFFPSSQQDIFYGGDAVQRVRRNPLYAFKVMSYLIIVSIKVCRLKPDKNTVLNPNWMIPQGLIALFVKTFFRKTHVITTVRGADIFALNGRFLRVVKKYILKKSDKVFVNSNQAKAACQSIFNREYIIAASGYDNSLFKPDTPMNEYYTQNKLRIISVGRLSREKGFINILKAVKKVSDDKNMDVHLTIAGDGPERAALFEYITTNKLKDKVELIGWIARKDLPALYQQADLFVGASIVDKSGWRESFGNVYVESMACGTPVIVSDTAGASELITNNVDGIIVKTGSINDLSDAIIQVGNNREHLAIMSKKAIETAKPYNSENTAKTYSKSINEITK